jgi:hypothetical protein
MFFYVMWEIWFVSLCSYSAKTGPSNNGTRLIYACKQHKLDPLSRMHPAARENDKISGCPPVRSHLPKGIKQLFVMMHASDQTTAEHFTITLIPKVQNASTAWGKWSFTTSDNDAITGSNTLVLFFYT